MSEIVAQFFGYLNVALNVANFFSVFSKGAESQVNACKESFLGLIDVLGFLGYTFLTHLLHVSKWRSKLDALNKKCYKCCNKNMGRLH